jgi:predicted DNA-binding transcriptional regulator YafY
MNKTERMYAVVEELRAVAPRARSVPWLARRFEVSVRTVERDLAALQQAGVPIWAATGRRGGYSLDTTMSLPPLNFTPSEAAAIAVALAVGGPTPLGQAAGSGLRKIVAAMSPEARRGAAELIQRIRVPEGAEPPTGAVATAVVRALADRRVLEIDYSDRHGAVTRRAVEPIGFVQLDARWYLVAWCRLRADHRAFRLDRIGAATVCLEPAPDRKPLDWDCELPITLRTLAFEPSDYRSGTTLESHGTP